MKTFRKNNVDFLKFSKELCSGFQNELIKDT